MKSSNLDPDRAKLQEILAIHIQRAQRERELDYVLEEQREIEGEIKRENPAYGTYFFVMREGLMMGENAANVILRALQSLAKDIQEQVLASPDACRV